MIAICQENIFVTKLQFFRKNTPPELAFFPKNPAPPLAFFFKNGF